jgi:excisionase family DNA binding protein
VASPPEAASADRLALRPKDAAKALGIGQRLLWTLTHEGAIPHARMGSKAIVYPVDALRAWLAEEAAKGVRK